MRFDRDSLFDLEASISRPAFEVGGIVLISPFE